MSYYKYFTATGVEGVPRRSITTATANQTEFSVDSGYDKDFIDVFYNGIKLVNDTDYDASDEVKVILTNPANEGDIIDIVAYKVLIMLGDTLYS